MNIFHFKEYAASPNLFGDRGLMLVGMAGHPSFQGPSKDTVLRWPFVLRALLFIAMSIYLLAQLAAAAFFGFLGGAAVHAAKTEVDTFATVGIALIAGLFSLMILAFACSLVPVLVYLTKALGGHHAKV